MRETVTTRYTSGMSSRTLSATNSTTAPPESSRTSRRTYPPLPTVHLLERMGLHMDRADAPQSEDRHRHLHLHDDGLRPAHRGGRGIDLRGEAADARLEQIAGASLTLGQAAVVGRREPCSLAR